MAASKGPAHQPGGQSSVPPAAGGQVWSRDERFAVWQTLEGRRANLDSMMWQTPALGMTAQAFLFTISLSPDTTRLSRIIACLLSVLLSGLVMHLMAKHRLHEIMDAMLLERIEDELGFASGVGASPHARPVGRHAHDKSEAEARISRSTPGPRRIWDVSSYDMWMAGQGLFVVAAVGIAALTVTPWAALLGQP